MSIRVHQTWKIYLLAVLIWLVPDGTAGQDAMSIDPGSCRRNLAIIWWLWNVFRWCGSILAFYTSASITCTITKPVWPFSCHAGAALTARSSVAVLRPSALSKWPTRVSHRSSLPSRHKIVTANCPPCLLFSPPIYLPSSFPGVAAAVLILSSRRRCCPLLFSWNASLPRCALSLVVSLTGWGTAEDPPADHQEAALEGPRRGSRRR